MNAASRRITIQTPVKHRPLSAEAPSGRLFVTAQTALLMRRSPQRSAQNKLAVIERLLKTVYKRVGLILKTITG